MKAKFQGRSYVNYNKDQLETLLRDKNWEQFYNCDNPDTLWEMFLDPITKAIDNMCPIKTFLCKKYKEPWLSQELLELIKDKDVCMKKAKRTKKAEDWAKAKRLRNDCLSKVRNAKAEFINSELNQHRDDSKKFWKNINDIIPSGKKNQKNIHLIDQTSNKEIPETDTASYINDFFVNIGPKLARELNTPWSYEGIVADNMIIEIITTEDEVLNLCTKIDVNKASCVYNISIKVLKDAFIVLTSEFTYLINISFKTGIFPTNWKLANIIPLFKGGNKNTVGNFRPVSLLPLPSKIIEKIAHNRISSFLETGNYLDNMQGGFRKNQSTINTTAKLTDDIFKGINDRNMTLSCFIDMAKAFDTVNHDILLQKLSKIGIGNFLLKWIKSYLFQRKQCTTANNVTSPYSEILCGVPQGSILGPLFFIVYVNDIEDCLENCKHLLYADDTVIYITGELNVTTNLLQLDLNCFKNWCDKNQLTMNIKKTKYVTFGLKSQTRSVNNHDLFIQQTKIDRVNSYKYLGITLDMNLNYNIHLENCLKLVSHKAFVLNKIRRYINKNTAITIYKTMILPIIEYGDVIYDGANQKLLNDLQTAQNRILRTCLYEDRAANTNMLHRNCNISKLQDRRLLHLNLFMYKQKLNVNIVNNRNIRTRAHDALLFTTVKPNNEKYKRNVFYKGALLWNNLPVVERNIPTYEKFKTVQKQKLL